MTEIGDRFTWGLSGFVPKTGLQLFRVNVGRAAKVVPGTFLFSEGCFFVFCRPDYNHLRTSVPFRGQTSQIVSSLPPKRDCGSKRVTESKPPAHSYPYHACCTALQVPSTPILYLLRYYARRNILDESAHVCSRAGFGLSPRRYPHDSSKPMRRVRNALLRGTITEPASPVAL